MKKDDIPAHTVFIRTKIPSLFPEARHAAEDPFFSRITISRSPEDFFVSESDARYAPYNQLGGSKKSFHLSAYVFSSNTKKLFFDTNLFYAASIAHIWYTASGDFFAPYRGEGGMLCLYRPDFVMEMKNGYFYIVEITDDRTTDGRIPEAKREYIEKNNNFSRSARISYVSVPFRRADTLFENCIRRDF